jgi:DNA-binding GntR family transcriptional regulator
MMQKPPVSISNLNPLEKTSLRDRVIHALRAAIISGELEQGIVYSAPSLGERFGTSATPVREAMVDLVHEGLVETVINKGFRVTEMTDADLDNVTDVRLLLEPPMVRQITPLIPDQDFERLVGLARRIVDWAAQGDLVQYTDSDRVFHLSLLEYANNPRLNAIVSELRAHTRLYGLHALVEAGTLIDSAREHLTIVELLRARDGAAVERFMHDHILQTRGAWAKP